MREWPASPTRVGVNARRAVQNWGAALTYDSWREIGMARPGDAAGVHSGVGGVSERDHGDAHRDSRARSDHAESGGQECLRGQPDAAVTRTVAARGGPN